MTDSDAAPAFVKMLQNYFSNSHFKYLIIHPQQPYKQQTVRRSKVSYVK